MKIAIAGKGGSGKTTIAGTLARWMARQGERGVLALDADSNPNLALTLGIPRAQAAELRPLRRDVLDRVEDPNGGTKLVLNRSPLDLIREYAVETPDGVKLLLMGKVEHAGTG